LDITCGDAIYIVSSYSVDVAYADGSQTLAAWTDPIGKTRKLSGTTGLTVRLRAGTLAPVIVYGAFGITPSASAVVPSPSGTNVFVTNDAAHPVPITGTVTVSDIVIQNVTVDNTAANPVPVTFTPLSPISTTVTNFPPTQAVSGTVAVSNLPAVQSVSGTVAVSNFPAVQAVSGSVTVTGTVTVSDPETPTVTYQAATATDQWFGLPIVPGPIIGNTTAQVIMPNILKQGIEDPFLSEGWQSLPMVTPVGDNSWVYLDQQDGFTLSAGSAISGLRLHPNRYAYNNYLVNAFVTNRQVWVSAYINVAAGVAFSRSTTFTDVSGGFLRMTNGVTAADRNNMYYCIRYLFDGNSSETAATFTVTTATGVVLVNKTYPGVGPNSITYSLVVSGAQLVSSQFPLTFTLTGVGAPGTGTMGSFRIGVTQAICTTMDATMTRGTQTVATNQSSGGLADMYPSLGPVYKVFDTNTVYKT